MRDNARSTSARVAARPNRFVLHVALPMPHYDVEITEDDTTPCECCRTSTKSVGGLVHDHDASRTVAAYRVGWTVGHFQDHGAAITLIVGEFGDDSEADDRAVIAVRYGWCTEPRRMIAFSVIDCEPGESMAEFAGHALPRDEVIGTPLAAQAFALLDAIWLQDARLGELTARSKPRVAWRRFFGM